MNIKELTNLVASEYRKGEADHKRIHKDVISRMEHVITCGEGLIELKKKVGTGWVNWLTENKAIKFEINHAAKIMRIGKHKNQVRNIVKEGNATTIDQLLTVIPRAAEEPLKQFAESKAIVGQTGSSGRNSDDWQTPGEYIAAARKVMGSIDLDPFTSVKSNVDIGATHFFTEADNAIECDWNIKDVKLKTVWMNPPYGRTAGKAIDKFLAEYVKGTFKQGIVLMNSATDTAWFHDLIGFASAVCFTKGRIAFISGDKEMSSNTKGQVFFYFGSRKPGFRKVFSQYGIVLDTGEYI